MVGLFISCKWLEASGGMAAMIPGAAEKCPQLYKDASWAATLGSFFVSWAGSAHRHLCCLPSGADPLDFLPDRGFPHFSLANTTLIWFGQQCIQTQGTDQDWSKPVSESCFLLSMTVYGSAWAPNWSVRWDGKKCWREVFSCERKKVGASFCYHLPALCFGHCHVMMPVTGQ